MTIDVKLNRLCSMLAGLALASLSLQAQTVPTGVPLVTTSASTPPPSAGLVNDWLRQQAHLFDAFDLGGQFRARLVDQTYFSVPGAGPTAVDFRANTPESANDFLLLRTRFHLGYSPTDWLTVFGSGSDRGQNNLSSLFPHILVEISCSDPHQELDLVATYQPGAFVQLQAGFGHYFTGDYVNETFQTLGGAHDANWVYFQAQFNF